ncbi:MAG: TMEM175 family protein [Chitinophagales bacterium]
MAETNPNSRLETFCDGVFAIALTLLIIDIKIPASVSINTNADFWLALRHIAPPIFAFVLSFAIILITWVNHHNALKLVNKSSASFIYANGFLLLTVAFLPFPTSLLGEFLLTDHAAPAVVLYESTMAFQAISWILISRTAVKNQLAKNEKSNLATRENGKYGYFAFALYSLCTITAFWFPLTIAIVTTLIWIFWLIWGINLKHE